MNCCAENTDDEVGAGRRDAVGRKQGNHRAGERLDWIRATVLQVGVGRDGDGLGPGPLQHSQRKQGRRRSAGTAIGCFGMAARRRLAKSQCPAPPRHGDARRESPRRNGCGPAAVAPFRSLWSCPGGPTTNVPRPTSLRIHPLSLSRV